MFQYKKYKIQDLYPELMPVLMGKTFNNANSLDSTENPINVATSNSKSREIDELTENQNQCSDDVDVEEIREDNMKIALTGNIWNNTHMTTVLL